MDTVRERRKFWKSILGSPPNDAKVLLIITSLPSDYELCEIFPRKGHWFNVVRRTMNVLPKDLRAILVNGSIKQKTNQ